MRSTIVKTFQFHAAHVIPHHQGKCARPHGHTYRVDVEITGPVQDDGPSAGMVVDFDDVKRVWSSALEPILDHQDLNVTLVGEGHIPYSTAEYIADFLLAQFRFYMPTADDVSAYVSAVRVWETPTSYAEAR